MPNPDKKLANGHIQCYSKCCHSYSGAVDGNVGELGDHTHILVLENLTTTVDLIVVCNSSIQHSHIVSFFFNGALRDNWDETIILKRKRRITDKPRVIGHKVLKADPTFRYSHGEIITEIKASKDTPMSSPLPNLTVEICVKY